METLRSQVEAMEVNRLTHMIRLCTEELEKRFHQQRRDKEEARDKVSRLEFPDTSGQ